MRRAAAFAGSICLCLAGLSNCGVRDSAQQTTPVATGKGLAVSPDQVRGLREALDAMIMMLEGERYAEFLETYADPEVAAGARRDGGMEALTARMAGPEGAELMRTLRATRALEPCFGPDANTAAFWQEGFPRYLVLRQIDGRWRVMN